MKCVVLVNEVSGDARCPMPSPLLQLLCLYKWLAIRDWPAWVLVAALTAPTADFLDLVPARLE